MSDWLEKNTWQVIGLGLGFLATSWAAVTALFHWHSSRLDERLNMQVMEAVNMATSEMQADLSGVRERVATLEAHLSGISEIRLKLDDFDAQLQSLPARVAEAMKK